MPGWVPRAIVLAGLGYIGLDLARWLWSRLESLAVMLLVSLFLALALEPAVNALEQKRGWRRGTATGAVMAVLVAAVALFTFAIGTLLFNQVSNLIDDAPHYIERAEHFVNDRFGTDIDSDELVNELTRADGPARRIAQSLAGNALDITTTVLSLLFEAFSVLLFAFYLVADGPRLRRTICSFLPPEHQREVLRAWEVAISKTGGYLYSRALLGALSAMATWVTLVLLDVPYGLALALWVGIVSQFVPVIGTYLAGALPVLIALADDPITAVWVLIFIVVYQQIENYLFAPRVTARTMSLHPAVAFGAVIAGAALLGGVGAVLALPLAASGQAFATTYIRRHEVVESNLTTITEHVRKDRIWRRWWRRRHGDGSDGSDEPLVGRDPVVGDDALGRDVDLDADLPDLPEGRDEP
jgi:predicted PurR-regulated permease PerM